jgi:NodT family efflux transporter outer membrane factor (OMF) lipoprotein
LTKLREIRMAGGALVLATPLALGACAVGPDYHRPALSPAAGYGDRGPTVPGPGPQLAMGAEVDARWWRTFGSPALDALVAEALEKNQTIAAAQASLRAAREAMIAERGALYPSLQASYAPSRQKFAQTLASPLQSGASLYSLTTSQVSVSYAPDLFGGVRRNVESLVAQQEAQRFELEAARLTVATNVVAAAVQDAYLRAQVDADRQVIEDQQRGLGIVERQFELGQASRADLAAQQSALAQAEAALPPAEKQFEVNRDLLAALVGRTPAEPPAQSFDMAALRLPDALPLSVPARLVAQRPDVRVAEAQLHAASAQIGVAAAARWPNVQIDAAAGSAALSYGVSLAHDATFWSIAGNVTQQIFQGGALRHRQRGAEAAYDQALAQYQAAVAGAFQNTADVLHALESDAAADRAARAAEAAADRSLSVAQRQLELGQIGRLDILATEQAALQARVAALQARAGWYGDVAALFQALGGGWWNRGPVPGGD